MNLKGNGISLTRAQRNVAGFVLWVIFPKAYEPSGEGPHCFSDHTQERTTQELPGGSER